MTSELHHEIRHVIRSPTAEEALRLARVAASTPSAIWNDQAWLTVAAGANSAAISDSRWLALCIFAHEKRTAEVAIVDALLKRARFLVVCGPDENDPFRDPGVFFAVVRRFIGGDSSHAALRTFQHAMDLVFSAERDSTEWVDARLQFMRGRRLRDIGRALRAVSERAIVVPTDLAEWCTWADIREVVARCWPSADADGRASLSGCSRSLAGGTLDAPNAGECSTGDDATPRPCVRRDRAPRC